MPKFGSNTPLDSRIHDDLIRQRGEWVKYYQGSRCPCGSEANHPDFACPNCGGLGHFYPHPPLWLCALITEVNMTRDPFGIPGFAIPGDLSMSARATRGKLVQINDWDKIVLVNIIDGIPTEGEDVIADPTGVDRLSEPIVSIESAYGIDPFNTSGVNFIVEYTVGVDFETVLPTSGQLYPQSIRWLTNNRPNPGAKYVIKYSSQPDWIVFNPPRPHVERGVPLGQTCLLRKRSLVLGNVT